MPDENVVGIGSSALKTNFASSCSSIIGEDQRVLWREINHKIKLLADRLNIKPAVSPKGTILVGEGYDLFELVNAVIDQASRFQEEGQ